MAALQTRSLADRMTDWTGTVTFDQIDPTAYSAATLTVSGTLTATAAIESLDTAPSVFHETDSGHLTVGAIAVSPTVTLSAMLGAADGTVDDAGAAGRTLSGSGTDTASAGYVATGTGGPPVFGTGTFTLPAYATAAIDASGPGNLRAVFHSNIAATAELEASQHTVPASASYVFVAASAGVNAVGAVLVGGVKPAKTAPQVITLAPQTTGWSSNISVSGFDRSLGQLVGVEVAIVVTGGGAWSAMNFDPEASALQVSQSAAIALTTAAGAAVDGAGAGMSSQAMLAAYDPANVPASAGYGYLPQQNAVTQTDAGLLAAFTGAGPVALQASGTGSTLIHGPGNLAVDTALVSGATITVTYDYLPADPLFDGTYYLLHNPDVKAAGSDPWQHYRDLGWKEGRDPSPLFDTKFYLAQNPDVAAAGIDPLLHFEAYGWQEGRDPSLMFSNSKYLAANPDVRAAGIDPLAHFDAFGPHEGRPTFLAGGAAPADPLVDAAFYDAQLGATLIPAGAAAAQQAAWSYDTSGWQKGLNPDALFDTNYYLSHNPDVAAAHIDPLLHYETQGWKEGRDPSAAFSTDKYLTAYGDVKAAGMDPLLHYVVFGHSEGRAAFAA